MQTNNSIRFNQNTEYNIIPTGGISVIPYQQNKVNDEASNYSKEYANKFIDETVYREGGERISLHPDKLNDIRRKLTHGKNINGNIYTQTYTSYINIDSRQRNKLPINIYEQELYNLPPFPLEFTNGSSIITVNLENHPFKKNDRIILNNVVSKNLVLSNVVMVKKNSLYVRIHHINHGLSLFGTYDESDIADFESVEYVDNLPVSFTESEDIPDTGNQYYILKKNANIDLSIQISGVKGSDITRSMIGNIPVNYLNTRHTVFLLFTKSSATRFTSDKNSYLIKLQKKSSINYKDGVNFIGKTSIVNNNSIFIQFNNLFGIPLNYINTGTPISEKMKYPYLTVLDVQPDSFRVDVHYKAIINVNDPTYSFYAYTDDVCINFDVKKLINNKYGGGTQCYARRIDSIRPGFPNPNEYTILLDKSYKNIIQARIISSIFPNSQRIINNQPADIVNNRLYWRNLDNGNYIYYVEIIPGNYTPYELQHQIEHEMNSIIRFPYTTEYDTIINSNNIVFPDFIANTTPYDLDRYDENGFNKYHLFQVDINNKTDIVSFSSFKERLQQDTTDQKILMIPDYYIQFTAAENFQINFGFGGTAIVPQAISPFNPDNDEILFIYFTPNTHIRIATDYLYANYNLYQYVKFVSPYTNTSNGDNSFLCKLITERAILVNFYRTKTVYPNTVSTQELNSINTPTLLQNFSYNAINKLVTMSNHNLSIQDLIITDQFIDPTVANQIFVYEITKIVDAETFIVQRYAHGVKYKFIYDGIIINFNPYATTPSDAYYWLDQILATDPILPAASDVNHNTLSFINITPTDENKIIMRVYQPNHMLNIGDTITIRDSEAINHVPQHVINRSHTIINIIDDDHYEVSITKTLPVTTTVPPPINTVYITYPDIFQMFFNYYDTLGEILSFRDVGQSNAITPYVHTVRNIDPYAVDFTYGTLGDDYVQRLKKLDMTGFNYFYIVSPELSYYNNTLPVMDVFAKIQWYNNLQESNDGTGKNDVVYNSYVPTITVFDNPVSVIYELNFSICHPDGRLVEFNGLDHSFTIEIIEVYNQPDETDINVRIDSEMIVRRTG